MRHRHGYAVVVTGREAGDRRACCGRPRSEPARRPGICPESTRRDRGASLAASTTAAGTRRTARESAPRGRRRRRHPRRSDALAGGWRRAAVSDEDFPIVELPVRRPGDVNRHGYTDSRGARADSCARRAPTSSTFTRSRSASPRGSGLPPRLPDLPVVMYTAQNVDKRFPPPFAQYERAAHRRVAALYPCSAPGRLGRTRQGLRRADRGPAARLRRRVFRPGEQSLDDDELVLATRRAARAREGCHGRRRDPRSRERRASRAARRRRQRARRRPSARARAAALGVADRLELAPVAGPRRSSRDTTEEPCRARPEPADRDLGRAVRARDRRGAGERRGRRRLRERRHPRGRRRAAILTPVGAVTELADRIVALAPTPQSTRRRARLELSRTRTWRRSRRARPPSTGASSPVTSPARSPALAEATRLARAEFGPTAAARGGQRPFALPVLRRGRACRNRACLPG